MLNQEVDNLIDSLADLRIRRENILCTLGDINMQETELQEDLVTAITTAAAEAAEPNGDNNPYSIGELLSITNNLRDEFRTTGTVIRTGVRLVTIRDTDTRRIYTRAWWNLAPIPEGTPARRTRRRN